MHFRLYATSSVVFASLFVAGTALAQDPVQPASGTAAPADPNTPATAAAQPAAATATPEAKDKPKSDEEKDEFKSVAITANPLSLILTRFGVNVEYLPVTHHAIVANPYF